MCAQSCPTLCDPMDCGPPGSSCPWDSPGKNTGVGCHGLLQRILQRRDRTCVSMSPALAGRLFATSTTWEAPAMADRLPLVTSLSQKCSWSFRAKSNKKALSCVQHKIPLRCSAVLNLLCRNLFFCVSLKHGCSQDTS